jgi:hypothetical protein
MPSTRVEATATSLSFVYLINIYPQMNLHPFNIIPCLLRCRFTIDLFRRNHGEFIPLIEQRVHTPLAKAFQALRGYI